MNRALATLTRNGKRRKTAASSPPATEEAAVPLRASSAHFPSKRLYSPWRPSWCRLSKSSAESQPERMLTLTARIDLGENERRETPPHSVKGQSQGKEERPENEGFFTADDVGQVA